MSYENPQQPDGINVSKTHPLAEFFPLLTVVVVAVVGLVALLSLAAGSLARLVPFEYEQKIARVVAAELLPPGGTHTDTEGYLQGLAQRLATEMALPPGMQIHVHFEDDDTVNAYATLGGHLVIFGGLLDRLPSENALALVVAHEIAHVKLRHPIVAMGRGATVSLVLGSLFGITDSSAVRSLIEFLGVTSTLSYNREQEREADDEAARAVLGVYGHLAGTEALFELFRNMAARDLARPPEFLSTHPGTEERLARLKALAAELGVSGTVTPLPR